jgi:hypothetical protein
MSPFETKLPVYASLSGIELPRESFEVVRGIALRQTFVDTFSVPMMAFSPPSNLNTFHPGPWAAVRGGFAFQARAELAVEDLSTLKEISPTAAVWLTAAVLRLHFKHPVRVAILANMPFGQMAASNAKDIKAVPFETASYRCGLSKEGLSKMSDEDLAWLADMVPVAARLYYDDRFYRAFSIYEQAQWSATLGIGMVLIWTAVETLFDLGTEKAKARAICRALSEYVSASRSDRDRAYQVIQDMYEKRGGVVHAARSVGSSDFLQSLQLAKVAFRRVLIEGTLPNAEK